MTISRRGFLKGTLATAAVALAHRSVLGANEAINVAVVGFNGRGKDHIKGFSNLKGVRLAALCDVDSEVLNKEAEKLIEKGRVETYTDIRKLLENKDIDVISIATPNHWHSLAAIWALQAGKDVYVEKPVCHNVWEGRQLVNAARKYKKIVQAGTQSRSNPGLREAIEYVQKGNLGKITLARGLCYKRRASIGKTESEQPVPRNIDYDLWSGPAPVEPLHRKKLHYDWHWVWPTGNGDLGNQGIHQMDIARWALGESELPPSVMSLGGRFSYVDDGETPNTMISCFNYAKAPLIFEVRGLPAKPGKDDMDKYRGASIGVVVHCEGGYLVIPNYNSGIAYDKDGKEIKKFDKNGDHYENFIKAVHSRKIEDLNGEILEGHLSSSLCHLGNISYRLGQQQAPEAIQEAIKANSDATEAFGRMKEHLAANAVTLSESKAALGPWLKFDPKTERFADNEKANQLLTREYRQPFAVPEIKSE